MATLETVWLVTKPESLNPMQDNMRLRWSNRSSSVCMCVPFLFVIIVPSITKKKACRKRGNIFSEQVTGEGKQKKPPDDRIKQFPSN